MDLMSAGVKSFAPAVITDLGFGPQTIGLAIKNFGNESIVKKGTQTGIAIESITGLPKYYNRKRIKDSITAVAKNFLEFLGMAGEALSVSLNCSNHPRLDLGSLESLAASVLIGINAVLDLRISKDQLTKFIVEDTFSYFSCIDDMTRSTSLIGNLLLHNPSHEKGYTKLPVPQGLYIVLIMPETDRAYQTRVSSDRIGMHSTTHLANLVHALYNSDHSMIRNIFTEINQSNSYNDNSEFDVIKEMCLIDDAIAFGPCGSGPCMFAICTNTMIAEQIKSKIDSYYEVKQTAAQVIISPISRDGAFVY